MQDAGCGMMNPDHEARGGEDFILASASPRRRALLGDFLSCGFSVVAPDFEEINSHPNPCIIPVLNAEGKGLSVSKAKPGSWVVSADTVIEHEGRIVGKPRSMEEAEDMLAGFSGGSHLVITAVAIMREISATRCVFADVTRVFFRDLVRRQIRDYFSMVDPMDKAGAYSIEERGEMLIDRIMGSRWNVAGLPLEKLSEAFHALGLGSSIRNKVPEPSGF